MPNRYSLLAKTARMEAVRNLLGSGRMTLLDAGGAELVSFTLQSSAGMVVGDVLMLSGFPMIAAAIRSGRAVHASLLNVVGQVVYDGMTVGIGKTYDVSLDDDQIKIGNLVKLEAVELRHF